MIAPQISASDPRLRGWTVVHLTAAAPGCAELELTHPRRWRCFERVPARQVVEAILRRLGKGPSDVSVRQAETGGRDAEEPQTEVELAIETDQGVLAAAYVAYGHDLVAIRSAIDLLDREHWRAPAEPCLNW